MRIYDLCVSAFGVLVWHATLSVAFTCSPLKHVSIDTLVNPLVQTSINHRARRLRAATKDDEKEIQVEDKNGNLMSVGSVVRVRQGNVKAFHVPAKCKGSFDDKKEFQQISDDTPAAGAFLQVPVGMRGVVISIKDKDELSANFPLTVKFTPGEHTDEGYDPPAAFKMHFGPNEIECV